MLEIRPLEVKTLVINFIFKLHCLLAQPDGIKSYFINQNQLFQNKTESIGWNRNRLGQRFEHKG